MKLELAKSAGFCYGVKRAVRLAEEAAAAGEPCVMLGPIIHNESEIKRLKALGVGLVERPEDVPSGAAVIIRSHGESRAVFEALERRGARIIDATCPNVSHIHRIVSQAEDEGRTCVIIGTPTHPEVQAIAGWCRSPVVLSGGKALAEWLSEDPERPGLPLTLVSQTTATQNAWNFCVEIAKKQCTNLKIFDTICNATCKRQSEAQELAARNDGMIVIGGRESSNTRRLTELCAALCPTVLWVERGEDLEPSDLYGKASIGITAGASTPGWIIKEVYDKMSAENMEIEESFAEMLEKSIKTLNTGEKVTGVVTGITPTEIYVDLGTKHAGYIPVSELSDDPTVKVEDIVKVGEEIETYVMRVNDQEGVVTLSKKRLDTVKSWDDIEQAKEDHTVVEGLVTEENKGGVVVNVKGIRVFVPASQTGLPRSASMSELVKQMVRLRITEVNRARRRVVGSIRAVAAEERAEKAAKVWAEIEDGKRYTGVVKSLTSYGAFVDIGGVDGMVHISELSWSRIKDPSEVVKVGDTVEVYVISADKEKKKISLGMKDRTEDPWSKFTSTYDVGSVANVKVVKLMTFGAFAEIVPGVDGLIHISQIADHRIDKPGDVLSEGQMVDVKITDIDFEHKKVSLSIRALLEDAKRAEAEADEE
ncbi:bifunctional 4-hydroxy-3-methylbut-2-enyl diphosphate reductase/30S ribosomal protein S1 [Flavonifractor sp. An92]|uniref:bifunctional 4-hydroxy-3-methylbut-2-enyl diphosphate reductase/30S ribosomal protein S1 n=1 Tax=Flavonifractor sp. An92 TaxID=1965666 RepID=UPI000B3A0A10|nr:MULTISPECIES: bifunctional 4-hydroxy-3-methylbut-2-enyl diphosphate reductase/30S ribosomal protein S1 [unclassified Flavonifractor]OUN07951.1 bifunctional 4-hydroxy-3-methylbut-2-enyl diphosphate reductase/30S ribosomal protein S1 [Flavonifractor sp. An92]OUQ24716.1 bifunctional 4-hydroxy-3-methylbut-2-enyl diphosphate reductase/30S ribosomal protein S1 [Flavonifractor sp. An135]